MAMMHLENFDVVIIAEPLRRLLDERQQPIHAEAHIRRPKQRRALGRRGERLMALLVDSGGADHQRLLHLRRERNMGERRLRDREFDHDIGGGEKGGDVAAGYKTDRADAGEIADILAEIAARRRVDAARQLAARRRRDFGGQHPPHAPGATRYPDAKLGHDQWVLTRRQLSARKYTARWCGRHRLARPPSIYRAYLRWC